MNPHDTRRLSPEAQEALRIRVVQAVRGGLKKSHTARTFGVSRASIDTWLKKVAESDLRALRSRPRGRPRRSRLAGWQAATTVRLITDRCPDQLKLPFALWTRAAVRQLLAERFDLSVSVWTVGRYLKQWGLTPQKPARRAYEQNPRAVREWLTVTYPVIAGRAQRERAVIYWGDQMGLWSDHQAGRSYGRRGETPVIPGTGRRFSCNMMSALTNRGELSFMMFPGGFKAAVLIEFLRRLIRQNRRKIFLILDGHPVHRSAAVTAWVHEHRSQLQLFFLPGHSPELNPDEYLNQDVKSNALSRRRPRNQAELIHLTRTYLWATQRQPDLVRRYFHHEKVVYAAR